MNLERLIIIAIRYTHPTHKDLEPVYFRRENLKAFVNIKDILALSFLYILFVDDFRIYKNMYRVSKGFYITLTCLDYDQRRKLSNEFILTLRPHGVASIDINQNLEKGL